MPDATGKKTGRPPGPGRGHHTKTGNGAGGAGWGGPAKGAGSTKAARPHGKEGRAMQLAAPPEIHMAMAAKTERKKATRETMLAVYERIADDTGAPALAQIAAATQWLNRVEGMPVQMNVNASLDKKDEDLAIQVRAQLIARLEAMAKPEPLMIEHEEEKKQ